MDAWTDLHRGMDIIRDWWGFNEARTQPETMAWDDHATSNRLANLCFWLTLSEEHGMVLGQGREADEDHLQDSISERDVA